MQDLENKAELEKLAGKESFMEKMVNRMGENIRVARVFGEPVERDGVTVIPVAKAWWGFGGGNGGPQLGGEGGGAGVMISPAGFIEIKNGTARFKPVVNPVIIALGMGLINLLIVRTVMKGVRKSRRNPRKISLQRDGKSKLVNIG